MVRDLDRPLEHDGRSDVTAKVTYLDLPVYFLHGVHDRTVSYALARQYLADLDAPTKGFYTFSRSAHSPFIEEPTRTQRILVQDVLPGLTRFADPFDGA